MTFILKNGVKSARKRISYKRRLTNKIFTSKTLIKYTNNNIIITLFTYNREKLFLVKKMYDLYKKIKKTENTNIKNHISKYLYKVYTNKEILKKKTIKSMSKIIENNSNIDKKKSNQINLLVRNLKKKHILNIYSFNELGVAYKEQNNLIFDLQKLYYYQNKILLLNSYKYKDFFLSYIKSFISNHYNKNVEFNIINLKRLSLSSDIFIQAIVEKLRNRKNQLLIVLNKSLSLVKPIYFNKTKLLYRNKNNKKSNCLVSKYNSTGFLNNTFYYNNVFNIEKTSILGDNVLDNLKNKYIKGIKIRAAGRLTRRLIAARSVSKFKYKGSIKNIDSSYKGLSTVVVRGYMKSNIQYTLVNSNTRNGSFGLKG